MTLPAFDFETYSSAGYYWSPAELKWRSVVRSNHGLPAVGATVYTEHLSAEVLSLAYNLQDGGGPQLWIPEMPPPAPLFAHIAAGGILEAWNSMFEFLVWTNICTPRMGWPVLPLGQLRCAMSKARTYSLPGGLEKVGDILDTPVKKLKDGGRLINLFGKPHSPTATRKTLRILPQDSPADAAAYYQYNLRDIAAESSASNLLPELPPEELDLWLLDQRINAHGCPVDRESLRACTAIVEQATERYTAELRELTGGAVQTVAELKKLTTWLDSNGVMLENLEAETVQAVLDTPDPFTGLQRSGKAIRVLEIRSMLAASSVKKLFAMSRMLGRDGRLHDLFSYYGADRTGRFTGRGPQPQNLPGSGPKLQRCDCQRHFRFGLQRCPWCGCDAGFSAPVEWCPEAMRDALTVIRSHRLEYVEHFFGEAVGIVSGCLRGLFVAEPGHDLISSDYSAIEAVVLAMLSGEQWRIDVFRTHGKIYEASASKITGVPFEEFMAYRERTGQHHPLRKKIGKYAELASGYQGWLGAWKKFGAGAHLSDDEIKEAILKWREQSPAIVALWAGLQSAAQAAVRSPGQCFAFQGIAYQVSSRDVLHCQLPSGRLLSYHTPRISPWTRNGRTELQLTYMGWNTDRTKGPYGWIRMPTYGGKLVENVTQATARDILTHAMLNVDRTGYPIVLHVHDEIVTMMPKGQGSARELESLMDQLPPWAAGWPVRATGGWRGQRYRKD
jgi:DNA polymerase